MLDPSKVYYIPLGIKNLSALFPTIDFNTVDTYNVQVIDSNNDIIATSLEIDVDNCRSDADKFRIHFLNYLGTIDALNFKANERTHEVSSSTYQKPTTNPLVVSEHSLGRFNVKSNDSFLVTMTKQIINDAQRNYYDELLDSPLAWLEDTQNNIYIPIIIADKKTIKYQLQDRYFYEINLEFKFSHEKIIIRN